jgi:metallophosphoesterase (TIGR00282 family)
LTGGNHTWKHREYAGYLEREPRALRPANYPAGAPGRGVGVYALGDGRAYAVVNLIARTFMEPVDHPFLAADRALDEIGARTRVIVVDFHGEATSEKRAMGFHLDGRVSAVWGTHTHVPTADEEILPGGTAYLTDIGMTGPYASVIGIEPASSVKRFLTSRPVPYRLADGGRQLRALLIDIDDTTGRARTIERITLHA